jgi:hypothetical protein
VSKIEIPPNGLAPLDIQDFLLRIGGKNPYGEPMYRMVRAELVRIYEGGQFYDWPENATISEMGGLMYSETTSGLSCVGENPAQPLRVAIEMRWTERYPQHEGWTLERWFPATDFGSRKEWESKTFKGHPEVSFLGPFPERGCYMMKSLWQEEHADAGLYSPQGNRVASSAPSGLILSNPRPGPPGWGMVSECLVEIPPVRVLETAITLIEEGLRLQKDLAASAQLRIKLRMDEWMHREQIRRAKRRLEKSMLIKEHMKPVWGSSLESARLRGELAKKAGIKSHVGA